MNNKKLTMMQTCLLFLLMSYSAIMRIVPRYAADSAKQAGWISVILGSLSILLIIYLIRLYIKHFPDMNYNDIMCKIVGRPVGKALSALYLLWFIILLSLYCRYFGERLVSSVYATTDIRIFIVVLLVLVGFMLRTGITVIARMNKLLFPVILLQLVAIIALLIVKVEIDKLTPITTYDIAPIFKGTTGAVGILVYLFFIFMIGDEIKTDHGFKKNMTFVAVYIIVINFLLVITLLGTFGFNTLIRTPLPLLIAVKNISNQGNFSGLESVFISLWILADFITVASFSYLILKQLKSLFNLKDAMPLLSAILPLVYIFSQYIAVEIFELQSFSEKIALQTNIIFGLGIPVLLLVIARFRKVI